MKLLLRRDQKSGLLGRNVTFMLEVRADLTPEERDNIKKYKLGDTMLYQKYEVDPGKGLLGFASRLYLNALNLTIKVDDLVEGKRVECKSIMEMLAAQAQIKEAAEAFKQVLDAASHFGGEEVLAF